MSRKKFADPKPDGRYLFRPRAHLPTGFLGNSISCRKRVRDRAVTLAYIVNHPEKAERFFRFAAIQEHKAVNAARAVVSQEEFDKVITPEMAEQIRKSYEEIKPEFQVTRCHECGDKGTAFSWDIDFAS